MKQSHGPALLAKKLVAEKLENVIRDSIVASIPACHAGDRGSIPRRGVTAFVPERSKGLDSSSSVFVLVGSNPTECKCCVGCLFVNQIDHKQTVEASSEILCPKWVAAVVSAADERLILNTQSCSGHHWFHFG